MTISRMQQRRDITGNWTTVNPVLRDGEIGLDTTLRRFKMGDGFTAWDTLPFFDAASIDAATAAAASAAAAEDAVTTGLATKADVDHSHVTTDITDLDVSDLVHGAQGFYSVKWNGSAYPNRSASGTVDPAQIVFWWGGPGPTKSGTGSTGAVTGDAYVPTS